MCPVGGEGVEMVVVVEEEVRTAKWIMFVPSAASAYSNIAKLKIEKLKIADYSAWSCEI